MRQIERRNNPYVQAAAKRAETAAVIEGGILFLGVVPALLYLGTSFVAPTFHLHELPFPYLPQVPSVIGLLGGIGGGFFLEHRMSSNIQRLLDLGQGQPLDLFRSNMHEWIYRRFHKD